MENTQRNQVTSKEVEDVVGIVANAVNLRVKSKGLGAMVSPEEVIGCLRATTIRFELSVSKGPDQSPGETYLKEIAVAAIFGLISMRSGRLKRF